MIQLSRQKNGFQNEKQFGGDILLILQRNSNQIVYEFECIRGVWTVQELKRQMPYPHGIVTVSL